MDQPKIERLLRLIKMMSGHENYTIDQLADKLGTSYRSIYRYIDTFKECGFVVLKVRSNVYKLGKMPKTHLDLKNLIYFSEEEAYIVNSLIDGLDVSNVLKGSLKKKLAVIYNSIGSIDYVVNREAAEHIEGLGKAIREKKRVILKGYESSHSNEISDRFIEPFDFTTNWIDVWGYDIEKQENRVFKISRIDRVSILEDDWANESKHQKSKTDCFRISGFTQTAVKLELSMMAKNLLLEEFPLAEKDLKTLDGKWVLETLVSGMEGVGRFVIGLAKEIRIIDSDALKEYIRNYTKLYLTSGE
jgi:predicted DNA-binding transcriptional regulator YafY